MPISENKAALQLSDGETFSTLLAAIEITGPELSVGATSLTTLADDWAVYGPTFPDGGEIGIKAFVKPGDSGHDAYLAMIGSPPDADDLPVLRIQYADTNQTYVEFAGFPTSYKLSGAKKDGYWQFDSTIRTSGEVKIDELGEEEEGP